MELPSLDYRILFAFLIGLSACVRSVPAPLPETFPAMLQRTEGVTCDQITEHFSGDAPDCLKIYQAWTRGRNRVIQIYPEARSVQMSAVLFYRPRLYWVDEKPYPLINLREGSGLELVRGVTSPTEPALIQFAFEQIAEHEAVHAIVHLVAGDLRRSPEAIQASTSDQRADFLWMIVCHGTPDDVFGEPGNIASCVEPYDGAPNPNLPH